MGCPRFVRPGALYEVANLSPVYPQIHVAGRNFTFYNLPRMNTIEERLETIALELERLRIKLEAVLKDIKQSSHRP